MKNELSLPNSWQMKTLGDLFEITSSKRVFKEDWKTEGVPFYRAREIVKLAENGFVNNELFISEEMFKEYSEKYGLPKESDIMVTGVGTLGICYVVKSDDRFYFKDGNIIWLKSNGKANSRYVEYAFKSDFLRKQIDDSVGATVGTYTIIKAKSTKIPLPPLPEQQRIVSILDEAFAAIAKAKANAEQNLKNAKELFESYLQGVFEKKGDGWEEKRFEELIQENQIGLIKSTKEQGNDKPYRYLKMDSITSDNNLIHDRYVYVEADKSELEKFTLNEGDFLFNTRNSYELVGKTCVFSPIDDEPTLFNNNIMRVVFKNDISSRFINYAFSSELVKERLQKLKSGTTSVVGIYYKGLRNLKIPVTKYKEQQTIVRQLDALRAETQKLETIYQQKLLNLEELKKSVLQRAFAGELT